MSWELANRLLISSSPQRLIPYTWDARGNLIGDGTFTYATNAAGRLVRAQSLTATVVYTYTADSLRVEQDANGTLTTYAWDWASAVPELLQTCNLQSAICNLYLIGHDTLGWWDGGAWAYILADGLGSMRQAADGTGAVASVREWTPYGEEVGGWRAGPGYTGEWQDAAVGLVYLRARWYAPGVGRFTQPDPWEGDRWQPVSLQPYPYASDNPVSRTDPSGLYDKDEVHFSLTLEIARSVLGHLGAYGTRSAWLIARGDWYMDTPKVAYRQDLHFVDWPVAHANAERAIQMKHPYVFGAALHQVQDYFSHYYEGFRFPGEGHLRYTVGERPFWTIATFLREHPRSWVETQLSLLYPGIDFSGKDQAEDGKPPFTDNELIDLYLREWRVGLSRWEERERYGYNTDRYFPHTYRDRQMEWETGHLVRLFAVEILRDPCQWYAMMSRGEDQKAVAKFFGIWVP